VGKLVEQLIPYSHGLATMVAQAVCGMPFKELHRRHRNATAPLDPFYQHDDAASNLPLAVALSPSLFGKNGLKEMPSTPLIEAFLVWRDAANDALQQTNDEGMRKVFEEVVTHGLALRWAAYLAPPRAHRPVFCAAGKGAYLDAADKLCWIKLTDVNVCEPCKHVEGKPFPPPGGIIPNTYTLASSATNPGVEGGGCVAVSSRRSLFKGFNHMYFTVQMKRTVTQSNSRFASYGGKLKEVMQSMPSDAPCIHLYWTPRRYDPNDDTLTTLLKEIRSSRGGDAAASGSCLDVVAHVNVEDCLTPSLAWTLTCAGFEAPPGVDADEK
jgi:hypothetical protein